MEDGVASYPLKTWRIIIIHWVVDSIPLMVKIMLAYGDYGIFLVDDLGYRSPAAHLGYGCPFNGSSILSREVSSVDLDS